MSKNHLSTYQRLVALLCPLVLLCAVLLPSCAHDNVTSTTPSSAVRYAEAVYPAPDNYKLNTSVIPEYCPDNGSLLVYAEPSASAQPTSEPSLLIQLYPRGNCENSSDLNYTLTLPEEVSSVESGLITTDFVYLVSTSYSQTATTRTLYKLDRTSGDLTRPRAVVNASAPAREDDRIHGA